MNTVKHNVFRRFLATFFVIALTCTHSLTPALAQELQSGFSPAVIETIEIGEGIEGEISPVITQPIVPGFSESQAIEFGSPVINDPNTNGVVDLVLDIWGSETHTRPAGTTVNTAIHFNVRNNGTATATDVSLRVQVPAGLRYTQNSQPTIASCEEQGGDIVCDFFEPLAPNEFTSVSLGMRLEDASCSNTVTIIGEADSAEEDVHELDNTDEFDLTVTCESFEADLAIEKAIRSDSVFEHGNNARYTIAIQNNSIHRVPAIVYDRIPDGLEFRPYPVSSQECAVDPEDVNFVKCERTLDPGERYDDIQIAFLISEDVVCDSTISNTALVRSDEFSDPNPINDNSSIDARLECGPDVSIRKAARSNAMPGGIIIYDLFVDNLSDEDTAIITRDTFDSRLTPRIGNTVGPTTSSFCSLVENGTVIECSSALQANQRNRQITMSFDVPADIACDDDVLNTAIVALQDGSTDPHTDNNTSSVTVQADCGLQQSIDLSINKSARSDAMPGQPLIYDVFVTNPSDRAIRVTMIDDYPDYLTLRGHPPVSPGTSSSCTPKVLSDGNKVAECVLELQPYHQNAQFTLSFDVPADIACDETIENIATVTGDRNEDPNPDNDTDAHSVNVVCPQTDVAITKTIRNDSVVEPGNNIRYVLTLKNNGPNRAQVEVRDRVPADLTFRPYPISDANCQLDGADVVCGFTLDPNEERTVHITFLIDDDAVCGSTISNTATITAPGFEDPNVLNNTSSIDATVECDGSELQLSLSDSTPQSDTVPQGSTVHMLSVDFVASCDDDVIVEGLTLVREGIGLSQDILSVWAEQDGTRITRTRVFDEEDQTVDLRFTSPLVVQACSVQVVDFMANFAPNATPGQHRYVVELASDVNSNAQKVLGNYPIRGETFEVASIAAGVLTVTYRPVDPSTVFINDDDVVVGRMRIAVDATEDQTLFSMMLENDGLDTGDGDVTNIRIRRSDGTFLTEAVPQTVGDYATLVFDPPFTILEGDVITLEVVADIEGGTDGTVVMRLEEPHDLFAVGSLYGYGANGQLYASTVSIDATPLPAVVSIDGGGLTIDIDGPPTEEYPPNATDVVFASVDFLNGEGDVRVREMYALIIGETATGGNMACGNTSAADNAINQMLEDVEMRDTVTGFTVDAVLRPTDRGTQSPSVCAASSISPTTAVYRFDDFVVPNNASRWELRADFIDNGHALHPRDGDRFRVYMCTADEADTLGCDFGGAVPPSVQYNLDAVNDASGAPIFDIRPGEDISGNFQRVAVPSLALIERSIGFSDVAVENEHDVNFFRFEAMAGKSEDVLLTKIAIQADLGTLLDAQNYTLWVDSDDDGIVDTELEDGKTERDGRVTFDDLVGGGYVIPTEESVFFEVHADIASSLSQSELSIGFADNNGVATNFDFVEAEEIDSGDSLRCINVDGVNSTTCTANDVVQIPVITTASKIFHLKNQGSLFVTQDTTPTRARQLLAGALGEAILRLELSAVDEPIDVTRLMFTNEGDAQVLDNNVNRLQLYRDDETTPFASATQANCQNISPDMPANSFCAVMEAQQLVIPEGASREVLVRPLMKSDEEGAGSDNEGNIKLTVLKVTDSGTPGGFNDSTGTASVVARGFNSANTLLRNDNDSNVDGEIFVGTSDIGPDQKIEGRQNDTVLAKIVSVEDANEADDGDDILQGLNRVIAKFQFKSATNNNTLSGRNSATLSGLIFTVSSTNVEFASNGFSMHNEKDATEQIQCTPFGPNVAATTAVGTFLIDCKASDNTAVDLEMDSGDSATLVIQADINNNRISSTAGSSMVVIFDSFAERSRMQYGINPDGSHVDWSDSEGDANPTYFKWIESHQTQVASTSYDLQ